MSNWDKKATAKLYNDYAKDEKIPDDQLVSYKSARYKRLARDVERTILLMSLRDDDRVLDAGCGTGRFIYRIRKSKNCQIVGIDTSRKMVERSRKRVPDANYLVADVLHLPLVGEYFTTVICHSVLLNIQSETRGLYSNKDVYEKGLQEFKRVLVVSGKVLFDISNPFHLQGIIDLLIKTVMIKVSKNVARPHVPTFDLSLPMAKHIIAKLGLDLSDIVARGYYPVLLETLYTPLRRTPSEKIINIYYNAFDRLEDWLRRKTLLRTWAQTIIIIAIKRHAL